ncbi:hypothetical protein ACWDV4_28390 [Micromonospora sp. NPDC003197]
MTGSPLLNPSEEFTSSLAAWSNPSFVGSLGHALGPAEPAGVLHDLAVPVPPASAHSDYPQSPSADPPLALPPTRTAPPKPSLQRQVSGVQAAAAPSFARPASPAPSPSPAPAPHFAPPAEQLVPAEPLPISRLTVAPTPPVSLTLPVVAAPPIMPALDPVPDHTPGSASAEVAAPSGSPSIETQPEPSGANVPDLVSEGVVPTIGVAAVEHAGGIQDSAADSPVESSYAPSPTSSVSPVVVSRSLGDSPPSAPSQPSSPGIERSASAHAGDGPAAETVQRSADFLADAGSATRPARRLGLGEPIVPPAPPMTAQRTPTIPSMPAGPVVGPSDGAPRAPAGPAMPMVQRTQAAASPSGPASNPPTPTPTPEPAAPTVATPTLPTDPSGTAELLGSEVIVSRLAESVGTNQAGQDLGTSNSESPTRGQFDELPLTDGPSPPESIRSVDPAPSEPVTPPAVTWIDTAPTDSVPTLGNTELATATPSLPAAENGSADGQSIQRLTEPESPDLPLRPIGGGGRSTPSSPAEGVHSVTAAAPPLVVARLIGDRSIEPLTGEGKESTSPYLPAPLPPTAQRLHWDSAPGRPAGSSSTAGSSGTGDTGFTAVTPASSPAPSRLDSVTPADAVFPVGRISQPSPADVVPVQRWTGTGAVSDLQTGPTYPGQAVGATAAPVLAVPYLASQPTTDPATPIATPVAQRLPEPAAPPDPPPTVPEEPAAAPEPEPAPAPTASGATPPPPAPGGGAPGSPGASGAAGATEPEELLKKLIDPLLRRLKVELRLDRERYGVLDGPD